jgi:hypothetical protein
MENFVSLALRSAIKFRFFVYYMKKYKNFRENRVGLQEYTVTMPEGWI